MFNQLTPAELERLAIMSEELSELATIGNFISMTTKNMTGMDGDHPEYSNLQLLELEWADLQVVMEYMEINNDFTENWYIASNDVARFTYPPTSKYGQDNIQYSIASNVNLGNTVSNYCHSAIKLINKIIRHGYESFNPFDPNRTTNRALLTQSIIELTKLERSLTNHSAINKDTLAKHKAVKIQKIKKYLHEQTIHPDIDCSYTHTC